MSSKSYKQILQDLTHIEGDYFIKELYSFDYDCLKIPHREALEDYYNTPYRDQKYDNYNNSGWHLFFYRMDHGKRAQLVADTLRDYCKRNQQNFVLTKFKNLLDKYPRPFVDYLTTNFSWS